MALIPKTEVETKEAAKPKPKKLALDISKIITNAQASYGKKEAGLANQLSTGTSIIRPSEDADFVVWDKGSHWKELTHLKGIPFGRMVQISGKPDSGKSSHAMVFMAAAQEQGHLVILWDAEKKFSSYRYKNHIHGDPENLLVVDTNNIINGAKAIAAFVHTAKEQNPDIKILIVWDSVGSSVNSTEDSDEDENFSKQPGVTAKEIAWAVRKFNKLMQRYFNKDTGKETIGVLAINQTYAAIGMSKGQIEKGGGELYYLSSVIIQLSRKKDLTKIKNKEKYKYGIVSRAKVKKNHLFEGDESISEMDIVVSSNGVQLARDVKGAADIEGWDSAEETDDE